MLQLYNKKSDFNIMRADYKFNFISKNAAQFLENIFQKVQNHTTHININSHSYFEIFLSLHNQIF